MLMHGIDASKFLIYNINDYVRLAFQNEYSNDPYIHLLNTRSFVINWFLIHFRLILQTPVFFILSSIILKTLILYLFFKIANTLLKEPFTALIASLYFSLSMGYDTHGVVPNGIFGSPIIFRASVSLLFTLAGLYFALNRRLVFSSIFFALSLHFHILYGITSLSFFLPGFILIFFKTTQRSYVQLMIATLILVLNISLIIYNGMQLDLPGISSTLKQWYIYCYSVDPDDMSLFYTIGNHGFLIIPLLAFALYCVLRSQKQDYLNYLFIGALFVLFIALGVEIVHRNFIFFGKLSEFFITVELRRGIWVLMFISFLVAIRYLDSLIIGLEGQETNNKIVGMGLTVAFLSIYLIPDLTAVGMICATFMILKPSTKSFGLILIFSMSLLLMSYWNNTEGLFNLSVTKIIFYSGCVFFITSLYILTKVDHRYIYLLPMVVFLVFGVSRGIMQHKFLTDFWLISNNGPFSYPNHHKLIKDMHRSKIYDAELVRIIKTYNTEKLPILVMTDDVAKRSSDSYIYNVPVYLSKFDISIPQFSRKYFEYFLYKLKTVGLINSTTEFELGTHGDPFYSKKRVLEFIREKLQKLSLEKLYRLNKEQGVGFILTKIEYPELQPLYIHKGYYLYSIELVSIPPKNEIQSKQ